MAHKLVIGNKNTSSWSLRPWLAMRRAGIAFDEINIDLRAPDAKARILEHSPSGKVPALLVGGRAIWDSLAILEVMAETHPALWPKAAAARALATKSGENCTSEAASTWPQAWIMRTTMSACAGVKRARSASSRMMAKERL